MDYSINQQTNQCTIRMRGQFTFGDNGKIRDIIATMVGGNFKHFTVDTSELVFVDSAALGMLLLMSDEARKAKVEMTLDGASGQVKKMLQLSNFDQIFAITYQDD